MPSHSKRSSSSCCCLDSELRNIEIRFWRHRPEHPLRFQPVFATFGLDGFTDRQLPALLGPQFLQWSYAFSARMCTVSKKLMCCGPWGGPGDLIYAPNSAARAYCNRDSHDIC
jgi:hypothetical protein